MNNIVMLGIAYIAAQEWTEVQKMSKKVKEYIREEAKDIQRLQEAIDNMTIEEKGDKATKQICRYIAIQAKLMTKTQEYLLVILSRIDEIGGANNEL